VESSDFAIETITILINSLTYRTNWWRWRIKCKTCSHHVYVNKL